MLLFSLSSVLCLTAASTFLVIGSSSKFVCPRISQKLPSSCNLIAVLVGTAPVPSACPVSALPWHACSSVASFLAKCRFFVTPQRTVFLKNEVPRVLSTWIAWFDALSNLGCYFFNLLFEIIFYIQLPIKSSPSNYFPCIPCFNWDQPRHLQRTLDLGTRAFNEAHPIVRGPKIVWAFSCIIKS